MSNIFGLMRGNWAKSLPLFCALTVSACGLRQDAQTPPPQAVEVEHPIRVMEGVFYIEIDTQTQLEQESSFWKRRLSAFLEDYRGRGGGVLTVHVPNRSGNKAAVRRILTEVKAELAARSIPSSKVEYKTYEASDGAPDGNPVTLSYEGVEASARPCKGLIPISAGSRDADYYTSDRRAVSEFGCATQKNLAAMVADPKDLLYPRAMSSSPAERRRVIYKGYLEGQSATSQTELKGGNLSGIGE